MRTHGDSEQDIRPGKAASVTLAEPRSEESGASATALALAAVRAETHTGGKFPAKKVPLEESASTFLNFFNIFAAELKVAAQVEGQF